ncbi:unnamed protein product [Clonostachys chloroleuca]|uniref:FAD-binding PCMH-type domain-containing protein n=1 Tax=Clonostachys chloroleuca TaxID=1926264 RepID=A0AA35QF85_9HYPO|nr:unnamed protein product [Clonostachys chloroleuca]
MTSEAQIDSFRKANPEVTLLTPTSPEWKDRRATRGHAGQEKKPLGIAIPTNAQQVAGIVRWAVKNEVDFTVRTGGNDFYGRNAADGALIIDMRDIKFINVADDKTTATLGGGVIAKDMLLKFDEHNLTAPLGNSLEIGYVGWSTIGGYGPFTGALGMGFEGIVGAEIVNHEGEIVKATDEMLEGLRGMGGNLGIVTSLTIKVYPKREILVGMLVFDDSPETIKAIVSAEEKLTLPKDLNIHHFLIQMPQRRTFSIVFSWGGSDVEEGSKYLETFTAALPPVKMNTVQQKSLLGHYESLQIPCLPYGGQRSIYIKELSSGIFDTLMEALKIKPEFANIGWSMKTVIDHEAIVPNCFGAGSHILLSFTDMVPEEKYLAEARKWNDWLYDKIRSSGDPAVMEGSYPALTRPDDRTAEQLFGDKWPRAKELKAKFDPNNVFKHAFPKF